MRSNSGVRNLDIITECFLRIPGISLKNARKAAIYFGSNKKDASSIQSSIQRALQEITLCEICDNLDDASPCRICLDPKRDHSVVCVTEGIGDLLSIEKSRQFNGVYHVIGGTLSALNSVTPEKLNFRNLYSRLQDDTRIKEVILAFGGSIECQNTSIFVVEIVNKLNREIRKNLQATEAEDAEKGQAAETAEKRIGDKQVVGSVAAEGRVRAAIQISRLASGMPLGAEFEYIDEGTIGIAIRNRELLSF